MVAAASVTDGDGDDLAFVCSEIDANSPFLFPDSRGAVVDGSDPCIAGASWSDALNAVSDAGRLVSVSYAMCQSVQPLVAAHEGNTEGASLPW